MVSFLATATKNNEDIMELKEYFASLSRETGVKLKIDSPSFKSLTTGRKNPTKTGVVATYKKEGYSFSIFYIERGKEAYAQQTIWLSFVFDNEPLLVFSVYDILAFCRENDFNCYTYTYVDSHDLMRSCFEEITALLATLLPEFDEFLQSGVQKNKLISAQKEKINSYFGSSVLEQSEMLGGKVDKLMAMMLYNFFQYQIESAVVGNQALFYAHKEEKALKRLSRSKYRSIYEDKLLDHLSNGGKAPESSETVQSASAAKGSSRHGTDAKGALRLFLTTILLAIPLTVIFTAIFIGLVYLVSHDGVFVFGIKENLIFLPFYAFLPGLVISLNLISRRKIKRKNETGINYPELPPKTKALLKYFTITVETIAIALLWSSVNSTTTFYNNSFLYSAESLPFSREECKYSSIDYIAIVEGYYYDDIFFEDNHVVFVTKSGAKIDLYDSTFFSAKEFEKKTADFFTEKDIEIKHVKAL